MLLPLNKRIFFLFVIYRIIQSITSSEMCSLHLTHQSAHTPGAVDTHTHTHTHTWSSGHTHTHTHTHTWSSGQTHTHTHTHTWSSGHTHTHTWSSGNTHTHTHTWSSGQPMLWRPGSSRGFGALLKGLTSVVDNSCRSRDSNPQPRVTSPTLYPLEPRLPLTRQWRIWTAVSN